MSGALRFCYGWFQNKWTAVCRCLHRRLRHRCCAGKRRWLVRAFTEMLKSTAMGSTRNRQIRKQQFYSSDQAMDATTNKTASRSAVIVLTIFAMLAMGPRSFATTKGLSQIVTPDLEPEGDFSLSFQIQDKRIANPYQLQAELGLTEWAEAAVFRGFQPDEWIFGTEIG